MNFMTLILYMNNTFKVQVRNCIFWDNSVEFIIYMGIRFVHLIIVSHILRIHISCLWLKHCQNYMQLHVTFFYNVAFSFCTGLSDPCLKCIQCYQQWRALILSLTNTQKKDSISVIMVKWRPFNRASTSVSLISNKFIQVWTCQSGNLVGTHLVKSYNTNQWNAQFSKLIFNFCCLVHVSNLVGSSSGIQLYMHYDMFYVHWCQQSGG